MVSLILPQFYLALNDVENYFTENKGGNSENHSRHSLGNNLNEEEEDKHYKSHHGFDEKEEETYENGEEKGMIPFIITRIPPIEAKVSSLLQVVIRKKVVVKKDTIDRLKNTMNMTKRKQP